MQSTPAGGSSSSGGGGGGGGELSRGGLSRIRSAPATWLEALLEEDDEDPLKPNMCLTELLTANSAGLPGPTTSRNSFAFPNPPHQGLFQQAAFHRQNSSPADFLSGSGVGSDGHFSNYGVAANFDYLSPKVEVSPGNKRPGEIEPQFSSAAEFSSQLKGERSSGQVPCRVPGMGDMVMDKIFEDSVPCRVRAKRGCATHPRSIAERGVVNKAYSLVGKVRRTRISDRIRKLQELVPDMDKQTNTAAMLEEAVEYVKSLQRQIQELTEQQKRCTCRAKEQWY